MTRKQTLELLPIITHFANGGELWYCNTEQGVWEIQTLLFENSTVACNIMEDKHFEARKAHALGEEIEYLSCDGNWLTDKTPAWLMDEYRPKPKEPIYEWQWIINDSCYEKTYGPFEITDEYFTEEPCFQFHNAVEKLEISKRIKQ